MTWNVEFARRTGAMDNRQALRRSERPCRRPRPRERGRRSSAPERRVQIRWVREGRGRFVDDWISSLTIRDQPAS